MPALVAVDEIRGGCEIRTDPPQVVVVHDVMMRPMGRVRPAGVYDASGLLVLPAAYRRGVPTLHYPIEEKRTVWDRRNATAAPPGFRYLFCGHVAGHYGHFLFALVARLWAVPRPVPDDLRIVLLNGAIMDAIFAFEFARSILASLGLRPEHFARFTTPTLFDTLAIAEPAIEENLCGHALFAETCHRVGRALRAEGKGSDRPVYLTKRDLTEGVSRFTNEAAFCDELERRGVEIVSPERLPFAEQVRLWRDRRAVGGAFGSILHTSVFIPRRRYVALNTEGRINSCQAIIDRLNGNDGITLHPLDGYVDEGESPAFRWNFRLLDPVGAAADFHREMERIAG